jgi:hypothetical protein
MAKTHWEDCEDVPMHARQREALYLSGLMVSADKTYSWEHGESSIVQRMGSKVRYATGQVLNCATCS